jgi:hypothetical protein
MFEVSCEGVRGAVPVRRRPVGAFEGHRPFEAPCGRV